ncbi:hypothetical protein ACTG9Q_06450 [Actinokineospora sp. 24-640]
MTETTPLPATLRVDLRPDWGTGPIWVATPNDGYEPYDSEEVTEVLDLSAELRADIAAWDDRNHATLNHDDPPSSGFPTPEDEAVFVADGKQLALRLRDELPGAEVTYSTIGGENVPLD